jgi:hypothetical protein
MFVKMIFAAVKLGANARKLQRKIKKAGAYLKFSELSLLIL